MTEEKKSEWELLDELGKKLTLAIKASTGIPQSNSGWKDLTIDYIVEAKYLCNRMKYILIERNERKKIARNAKTKI